MEAIMFDLVALACLLGMLAMMGGMAWMARRSRAEKPRVADTVARDARETGHA